ncbi:uncharacterized protein SPAPADRAFT_62095 [Spathaspora passalidarum NRRL Y-27907]|uniref:Alcohol acetyltransferase n=1 Tax=Spathaspora passalidarum (strain NRRL Y-27907 / 11-Y1) TaxID=619300 RepID=G3AQG8_SPAPN|nr:uncharacterized protein SPAPADRAFT_62095 [Spathaspora passalidarum NRRL Y-27907]EGW31515.1 hypothetical protein SPAPADRAFT_62095 [Spathaspora passalidarum NRRL Y-27907]
MVQPQHIRKPEFNERYYICRCTEGYSSNFSITAKYSKQVNKELLSNALHSLIKKNSWLTHNYFRTEDVHGSLTRGKNYEVRVLDSIKFSDVVTFRNINTYNEEIAEEVNRNMVPMDTQLPLWRIIVFHESSGDQLLCIYVDHSNYDGLAVVQFHKDLTQELANAEEKFIEEIFSYQRDFEYLPKTIMPAAEIITDLYIPSYFKIIRHYLEKYVPFLAKFTNWITSIFTRKTKFTPNLGIQPLFHTKKPVERNLETKFKFLNFTPDQVVKITKFCRSQGITLTSYFNVLFLKTLEETVFKAVDPSLEFSTSSLIAVNGRRYYSEDIKNFRYGTMICGDQVILPPVKDATSSMKYFHQKMVENIKSKVSFKLVGMYNHMNCWEFFKRKIGKIGGRFTLTISNLGKVENSNSECKLEKMYFCSNSGVVYNFLLNMTTTPNNELTVVVGYIPEFDEYELDGTNIMQLFFDKLQLEFLQYCQA